MEKPVEPIGGLITDPVGSDIEFTTPDKSGPYRRFVRVLDGHRHVAYGNVPFLVQ